MKDETTYLTKEKHEELVKELDNLVHVRRKEVAESLEYAKSLGDLSENAEYHEARDTQAAVEDRIARIEQILKTAVILSSHDTKHASVGSSVTLQREGDKDSRTYTLVSPEESDPASGKISIKSPLGIAVLGKTKGETFSFMTPSGKMEYIVQKIA